MATFTLTTQSIDRALGHVLKADYVWTADQTPSGTWVVLAGFPVIPNGGLVLAIDATEAMRVGVRTSATPLTGGDPVEGFNLPIGAREVLFVVPEDVIYIRTP
jgi:hypothetical protein